MAPPLPNYAKLMSSSGSSSNGSYQLPPPSPPSDHKPRSSTTLFDMISHDQVEQQQQQQQIHQPPMILPHVSMIQQPQQQQQQQFHQISAMQQQQIAMRPLAHFLPPPPPPLAHSSSLQDRINALLAPCPQHQQQQCGFNDSSTGDLRLTLVSRDGLSITASVHTKILVSSSRYFATKLSDARRSKSMPYTVEITDCDDVELYLLTIKLMYARDIKRSLCRENVVRALGILKVAAAIVFDGAIASCLEYLEAIPWSEDEEDKVVAAVSLSQLQLDFAAATQRVLKRVVAATDVGGDGDTALVPRIVRTVLEATSDRGRRDMKLLVARLLRDNVAADVTDVSRESLYAACRGCLEGLVECAATLASASSAAKSAELTRHVDGLQWLVQILLDRQMAAELADIWARQSRLAEIHRQMAVIQRHEISRVSAQMFVAIGRGHVICTLDVRNALTRTWLEPLIDDFAWLHRTAGSAASAAPLPRGGGGAAGAGGVAGGGFSILLDRRTIEEGVCATILTLPAEEQRRILLGWFDRFSRDGENCPNLQRAFEVWWRRSFLPVVPKLQKQQPLLLQ